MHIDREDMLELTRRMTVSRNCFSRIAGAYMDEEGFIDGTFNTHFLKLSGSEKEKNLNIAKTVPYSNTNVNLKNYRLDQGARKPGSIMQLLEALRQCELKMMHYCTPSMNILGRDTSRDILMPFIFLRQLRCTHQGKRQREPVGVRGSLSVSHRHDQSSDRRLRGRKTGGGIFVPCLCQPQHRH